MSYFISYLFLQLMLLILMEGFCLIAQEGYRSLFLKMPVNAVQYRVTVEIFNNRKLIINLRSELPFCLKLSNNLPKYDPNYISLLFYIFLCAFLFSKSYVSKISTKLYISIFLLFNILLGLLVWLYGWLIILSGDIYIYIFIYIYISSTFTRLKNKIHNHQIGIFLFTWDLNQQEPDQRGC